MCGIAGFSGIENKKLLKKMCDVIRHRGPDDEGFYADGNMNLGMRRLSIVDLASGKQPISNEDGSVWVVFNGEIYNHQELRQDLERQGHIFKTDHSDTEVIPHLYEEYGEDWAKDVNGMFGVAIWDKRNKRLLLFRDRIGIKPLYYSLTPDGVIFGSEIKSLLLHPSLNPEMDWEAFSDFLGHKYVCNHRSIFKGIQQIQPGEYLVHENRQAEIKRYWHLDFSHPLGMGEGEATEELFRILDDSVRLRMQCDVPFGAYLSGGVDSTSIVSLMCRHHTKPVITFCLGYEDSFEGKDQDFQAARKMSQVFGTEHHEYILKADEVADLLPKVLESFDSPFSGTVSTYFLSILITQHVKVALSGDGSDELFGSYLNHRLAWPIHRYMALKAEGKSDWKDLSPDERLGLKPFDTPDQFSFMKGLAHPDVAVWRNRLLTFGGEQRKELLTPWVQEKMRGLDPGQAYSELSSKLTSRDMLNASLELDQRNLLPNNCLAFADRLSMAHSIELRVPFLDHRLVEFAMNLPGGMKIRDGINKYIWKKAAARLIPQELIDRPKEGFVLPVFTWLNTVLRPFAEETLNEERLALHGMFQPGYVRRLLNDFFDGHSEHAARIWNLICFQVWWEKYSNMLRNN